MKKYIVQNFNLYTLCVVYLFITKICFAENKTDGQDFVNSFNGIINVLPFLFFFGVFAIVFGYIFLRPIILKKKTKDFCLKNHLNFTAEAETIPNSIQIKFLEFGGEKKYLNIMQGEKKGIYFTICDYYLKYKDRGSSLETYLPLLLLKRSDIHLPYFFLRTGSDLERFRKSIFLETTRNKRSISRSFYGNLFHFYEDKYLDFDEDENFSNKYTLCVEDIESAKAFFDDRVRNILKDNTNNDYIYEGNEEYFIICAPHFLCFEERLKFLEENLKLFNILFS